MKRKLKKFLKLWTSNGYVRFVSVFIAVTISDFIWTKYISSISQSASLGAACWGVVVIVLGAYVTVSYVEDKRLIAAAALGAFVGTYLGV